MELREVADRLYGLSPAQFTPARNDEADLAKQAGDAELSAAIKRLRKPSTAAWAANLLARERSDQLGALVTLGAELRQAQDVGDATELRRLSQQRHRQIGELTRTAATLAAEAGQRLTDAAAGAVAATLEAAAVDAGAAAAAASGRLMRTLSSAGFDAVDLDGAVAADAEPTTHSGRRPALRSVPTDAKPSSPPRADRAALDRASERTAQAERALVKAEASLSSADDRLEQAKIRVENAEQELAAARAALPAIKDSRTAAKRDRDSARRARDVALRAQRNTKA